MTAEIPFTPEMGARACEFAADGKLVPELAKLLGVSTTTLNKWRRIYPLFGRAFDAARDTGIDALVDQLPDIARDTPDPHRARILCEQIRWIAERRARRRYGQQVDINLTERVDVGGTLIEARRRALPGCNLPVLAPAQDAEYSELLLPDATDTQSVASDETPNPFD